MCLSEITRKPDKAEGWGWQVVRDVRPDRVLSLYCERFPKPRGKWLKAELAPVPSNLEKRRPGEWIPSALEEYEPGFHVFLSRSAARAYRDRGWGPPKQRVVRVQFRGAFQSGKTPDDGIFAIVASEIRIPTVEEWRLAD